RARAPRVQTALETGDLRTSRQFSGGHSKAKFQTRIDRNLLSISGQSLLHHYENVKIMQIRILSSDHRSDNPLDSGPYAQAVAFLVSIGRSSKAFAGST